MRSAIFISLTSEYEQTGEFLESSTFSAGDNGDTKWSLKVYPKGRNEESVDHLAVFLRLVSCNKPEVKARFKIFILNAQREKRRAKDSQEFQQIHSFRQVRAREAEFLC